MDDLRSDLCWFVIILSHIHITDEYVGTLTRHTSLLNTSTQKKERISKLLLPYASEHEEVDSLPYGSVGVILGLQHTRTGDTLISTFGPSGIAERQPLPAIVPPPANISASIIAQTQSDLDLVKDALTALSRTDPSARWTEEEGQILVHGLGALHLEIVEGRLRDEFGVQCQMGKRQVSYREAFPEGLETEEAMTWTKEINGKPSQASVTLLVRPMKEGEQPDEGWNGNVVVRAEKGTRLPATVAEATARSLSPDITSIIQGLNGPLSASPHTHLPLFGLHVSVQRFSNAPGSPPAALAAASSTLLRKILQGAGPGDVMEPYIRVKVNVPETVMGKVVKDLTEHNGEILDLESGASASTDSTDDDVESAPYSADMIYVPPRWVSPCASAQVGTLVDAARLKRSIHAVAPLSKMLDYTTRLRAVSGGQATFIMSTLGFRKVGPVRRLEVLKELGRA
jgi:elongation factor G